METFVARFVQAKQLQSRHDRQCWLVWLAGKLKEQGNAAFKAGQLKFARNKYTKALRLADRLFDIETEEQVLSPRP